MGLRHKQTEFAFLIAEHILWLREQGYEVTLGDAYRDRRSHGEWGTRIAYGNPFSNHKRRLALDINLFRDGKFLSRTKDHEFSGTHWESLHLNNRWGGRYNDGNHYEYVPEGWR
jgi:hypothetical protein